MELTNAGLVIDEVAPGVDIGRDILDQAQIPLTVARDVKLMPESIFQPDLFGLNPVAA